MVNLASKSGMLKSHNIVIAPTVLGLDGQVV